MKRLLIGLAIGFAVGFIAILLSSRRSDSGETNITRLLSDALNIGRQAATIHERRMWSDFRERRAAAQAAKPPAAHENPFSTESF
jgi:gas vesicle protein